MTRYLLVGLLLVGLVACDEDDVSGTVFGTSSGHIKKQTDKATQDTRDWYNNPDKNCAPGYQSVPTTSGYGTACAPK